VCVARVGIQYAATKRTLVAGSYSFESAVLNSKTDSGFPRLQRGFHVFSKLHFVFNIAFCFNVCVTQLCVCIYMYTYMYDIYRYI